MLHGVLVPQMMELLMHMWERKSVKAFKIVLQEHILERRVQRRIAEQILDTALSDVEEPVFIACRRGADRRLGQRVTCRRGAGRRLYRRVTC